MGNPVSPDRWLLAASFVVAATTGCADKMQSSSETHFARCTTSSECRSGESCVAMRCVPASEAARDGSAATPPETGSADAVGSGSPTGAGGTGGSAPSSMPDMASPGGAGPTHDCTSLKAPTPVTDGDRACNALAVAACARMSTCMPGAWSFPPTAALPGGDADLCRQRLAMACMADLALPGSPSADEVNGCASLLATFSCERVYEAERYASGNWNMRPLTHEAALDLCGVRGTLPNPSACSSSIQCASGNCIGDGCGHCGAFHRQGEECHAVGSHDPGGHCPTGLFCNETWKCDQDGCQTDRSTCQPLGGEGDPCPANLAQQSGIWSEGCALGLECITDPAMPNVPGHCVRRLAEGALCVPGREPDLGGCDAFAGWQCVQGRCARAAIAPLTACPFTLDDATCDSFDTVACGPACVYPATPQPVTGGTATCVFPRASCEN